MSCTCGCDKVEDHGSETFCIACGSIVKQVRATNSYNLDSDFWKEVGTFA